MTTPHDVKPSIENEIGSYARTGSMGFASGRFYASEPVAPWTPIHVTKANEAYSALTPMLDKAIAEGNYQAIETLTRSQLHLSTIINGFYGR